MITLFHPLYIRPDLFDGDVKGLTRCTDVTPDFTSKSNKLGKLIFRVHESWQTLDHFTDNIEPFTVAETE
jgi:hypothetical protein